MLQGRSYNMNIKSLHENFPDLQYTYLLYCVCTLTYTLMVCRPVAYFCGCHGTVYKAPPPLCIGVVSLSPSTHTVTVVMVSGENAKNRMCVEWSMRLVGSLDGTRKWASFGFVMSTRGHWSSRVSVNERRSWSIARRRNLYVWMYASVCVYVCLKTLHYS